MGCDVPFGTAICLGSDCASVRRVQMMTRDLSSLLRMLGEEVPSEHLSDPLAFIFADNFRCRVLCNVLDVVVDMRKGSPTYGHHACFELVGDQANSLYIAKGVAHGFYVKSKQATLLYNVSTYYAPMHDGGVRWDSVGVAWPCGSPLMSDRDRDLLTFPVFETPF